MRTTHMENILKIINEQLERESKKLARILKVYGKYTNGAYFEQKIRIQAMEDLKENIEEHVKSNNSKDSNIKKNRGVINEYCSEIRAMRRRNS